MQDRNVRVAIRFIERLLIGAFLLTVVLGAVKLLVSLTMPSTDHFVIWLSRNDGRMFVALWVVAIAILPLSITIVRKVEDIRLTRRARQTCFFWRDCASSSAYWRHREPSSDGWGSRTDRRLSISRRLTYPWVRF